jgi:hypothetical protein
MIESFTPLPSVVNPKDTVTLQHLLIESFAIHHKTVMRFCIIESMLTIRM